MNRQSARIGLVVALLLLVIGERRTLAATCTGEGHCRACKNCRYCRHCAREGGTCGVCKRQEAPMTNHLYPLYPLPVAGKPRHRAAHSTTK
jgi:hypothetical protein